MRTVATSILKPFARPLKVGGNKENMANAIVCPAAFDPSNVTVKWFSVDAGEDVGVKDTATCFHVVCDPLIGTEAEV